MNRQWSYMSCCIHDLSVVFRSQSTCLKKTEENDSSTTRDCVAVATIAPLSIWVGVITASHALFNM
eukprot:1786384-Amphidinium_carterae.1